MNEEIVATKRFFASHNITLSDFWLESCIQWYREENPNLNYTQETLNLKVYEQWLLLDLREVEVPILPPNINQHKKYVLNGTFSLQLLQVLDISLPKMYQIQKIRNSAALSNGTVQENQTDKWGKRMLQLTLTDGLQEIQAVEYKPISKLNVNLRPGTKIKMRGPVTIRRGQIMLEENHINILGGEVEELLVSNAAENILARALNLPLNPNPLSIHEETANIVQNNNRQNINPATTNNVIYLNNIEPVKALVQKELPYKAKNTASVTSIDVPATTSQNSGFHTNDMMDDYDMLCEIENNINKELKSMKTSLAVEKMDTLLISNKLSIATTSSNNSLEKQTVEANKNLLEDFDLDLDFDLSHEQLEVQNNQNGIVPISSLIQNRSSINSGKFTINAKFKSVLQKLTVNDKSWLLKISVKDATGDLEACVDSDVISNLMGFRPSEIWTLKQDILNKDEYARAKLMQILLDFKVKLEELDCTMELRYKPNEMCPTIVNFK